MFWVYVGTDPVGQFVNILRDEDELLGGDDVRFRLVLQTEDQGEAIRVAEQEKQRIREERRRPIDRDALERAASGPPT
jgi:hypothetical protein